ncbi:MAG: GGDEF domain-containing protein [Oceanospirillaceae bacterium]
MTILNHEQAKHKQVNRAIVLIFWLNIAGCSVFLYQFGMVYSSVRPVIQYLITAVFFIVFISRYQLSLQIKLIFLILYGLITTTAGLLYVGTMTISLSLFTIIVVVGALYYEKKQLYALLLAIASILSVIGYAYTQGYIEPKIKPDLLITTPVYWVSFIVLMLLCFLMICNAIISYRDRIDELYATIELQNQQLLKLLATDPLTDLASSRLVDDRLQMTIKHCNRYKTTAAVLFIDIDNFKQVNDSFGHTIGDDCLKELAKRLTASVRETDTVARLGGDEFLVILEQLDIESELEGMLQEMLNRIRHPIITGAGAIKVTCSIGAAIIPQDGNSITQLKSRADEAMYQAKRYGKNQFFVENLVDEKSYAR